MSPKIASILSAVITAILVFLSTILFGFGGIVALNGFMNADTAVTIGFACFGIGILLSAIAAGIFTSLLITKFNLHQILAMIVSIFTSSMFGGGMGFASMMIMIIAAEAGR